jgi:hypothetical protein
MPASSGFPGLIVLPETGTSLLHPSLVMAAPWPRVCAWCRLAIARDECDPLTGAPWRFDGQAVHLECGDWRAGVSGEWHLAPNPTIRRPSWADERAAAGDERPAA